MTTAGNTVLQPLYPPSPIYDPLQLFAKVLIKLYSIWVSLTYPFASTGRKLSIHYTCDLSRLKAHRIKLGNSVQIRKDATINVVASPEQDGEPIILVGDKSCIGERSLVTAKNCVQIERDVIIAQSVLISDHGPADEDGSPPNGERGASKGGRIRIGQGSWIGRGAAIVCTRGELVLGRQCVVGANALVTRSFPPYSVILGNPARVVRQFNPEKKVWMLGSIKTAAMSLPDKGIEDHASRVGRDEPHAVSSRESRWTAETAGNMVVQPPKPPSPIEDPLRLFPRILTKLYSIWVSLTYPFASLGRKLSIHYTCDLSRHKAHRIKLGNSVRMLEDVHVNILPPAEQNGEPIVTIDDGVGIGQRSQISAKNCIHLEQNVMIAQSVLISDHSYAFEDGELPMSEKAASEGGRIRIGEGSWIGHGATILCTRGELVLGRHCVVAANALVTRSFPPYSIIIGNPALVVRRFDLGKNAWVIGFARSRQTPDTTK
jgi:acetyltransferase-like isoleucine patch superfamily enzyme